MGETWARTRAGRLTGGAIRAAQRTRQWCFFLFALRARRAARVAYWKTSRTPSPVRAEHSR
jgi:hypothetical protein